MKFIHILFFLVPLFIFAQEENEENGFVREMHQQRLEKLYQSAGTKNLSLLNYRASNLEKQKQQNKTNAPAGVDGYTSNNGNWTQINTQQSSWGMGRINCFALHPTNGNILYAGTPTGGLWKTTDNGATWNCLTSAMAVPGVSGVCIDPTNTNIIYILTGSASSVECQSIGVFKTTDGGVNWQPTALDSNYVTDWFNSAQPFNANKLVMDPNNSQVLLAAMTTGLYRTTNGGDSWTRVIDDIEVRDVAFHPTNSNYVYVTTAYRTARGSINNGQTFGLDRFMLKPAYLGNYSSLNLAVSPAAPDSVFFVGTSDNGALDSDSIYVIRSEFLSGSRNFSFSRYNKCVISGADYAVSALRWYRDARLAVSPTSTADMYVNGLWTYATSNYGVTWRNKHLDGGGNTIIHSDATQIDYENGFVYASNDGGIYRQTASTTNATQPWTILSGTMPISQIFKLGANQANTTNFVTALQDNGCHSISPLSYSLLNSGDGIMARMSQNTPGTYYYRVNNFRTVRHKAGADVDISPFNTNIFNFGVFEIDPADETRIYTAKTNLYISTSQGDAGTWTAKTTGATRDIRLLAVSKTNNQVFWLLEGEGGGNNAVMRRSTDGGTTFQVITLPAAIPINLISNIVVSPFNENKVFLTIDGYNANAKVFETSNGMAASGSIVWNNLSSGLTNTQLPNVPVLCLAYESTVDNSIYVGTEIGMYYYNSIINRWIPFNNGMPVCRISDLYINYASLKVIAATYGRGIFISDFYTNCNTTLSLSGAQSGALTYSAGSVLNSTAQLSGGEASAIKYYSGTDLYLTPGFDIAPGTKFLAAIGPCGGKIDPIFNKPIKIDSTTQNIQKRIPVNAPLSSDKPAIQNEKQELKEEKKKPE